MTKQEIIAELKSKHLDFKNYIFSLGEEDFLFSLDDQKWTAGQEVVHIIKSVSPLNTAFALPKSFLKLLFGKANRPSKNYDGVVRKYHLKLGQGRKAPARYVPKKVLDPSRTELLNKLAAVIEKLCNQLERFTERDLDFYILPHPVLGVLTLREMLYFTIYHVQHHQKNSIENLSKR